MVSSSKLNGTPTIEIFGVKPPKCGISGTVCPRSQRYDRNWKIPDRRSKNYIRFSSERNSSAIYAFIVENLNFKYGMKPLHTFCMILRFFDLRETWITLNWIWKRYQEKNHNFPTSWHRFLRLAMYNDCVCIYGDQDESHVFLSLLYGLAFMLGTYWITETVSCNATGAVPRYFELTHSHTPVYRFLLDRWIRSIYRDSATPFIYRFILKPIWDPYDHFFQCETPKMRYFRHFLLSFSNIRLNHGVSR